eukprot:CAMPEP_0202375702 /NCGR_PEP_ID=MMETSP1127-20130417/6330_1 /ASSEMBLY_ACC=CAM_ASM_000462 /TAXON_ID=3047 /ORGANISM="Dunaliella tertiolecta, Strain CCMP1320" /LENGTH=213 /DNA_ID=CAMNT_0048973257 /DNA_START=54 /DNA_END=698 /DNA_ORIENTATION=+
MKAVQATCGMQRAWRTASPTELLGFSVLGGSVRGPVNPGNGSVGATPTAAAKPLGSKGSAALAAAAAGAAAGGAAGCAPGADARHRAQAAAVLGQLRGGSHVGQLAIGVHAQNLGLRAAVASAGDGGELRGGGAVVTATSPALCCCRGRLAICSGLLAFTLASGARHVLSALAVVLPSRHDNALVAGLDINNLHVNQARAQAQELKVIADDCE